MTSLQFILRINAASCIMSGVLFLVAPYAVAAFLGEAPAAIIFTMGIALSINAALLLLASLRPVPIRAEVLWFSLGDLLWWVGSILLIAMEMWITTDRGIIVTWAVALAVACIGLVQLWLLGKESSRLSSRAYWSQIGRSWLAIPTWVKIWLFFLNGIFLAAVFFETSELSPIILAAYIGSAPLLLAFAFYQGGMSRIMGIGHLVPWVPMVIWLVAKLWHSGLSAPDASYGALLAVATSICLACDIHDIRRWLQGEREIFGMASSSIQ